MMMPNFVDITACRPSGIRLHARDVGGGFASLEAYIRVRQR